jgi:hypothetical protein
MTTDPLRGVDPNAIRVTYGLETGPVGAWMKAYRSSVETREPGFVKEEAVEVSTGSGVEVNVGLEVASACKTSRDLMVWSATAFA